MTSTFHVQQDNQKAIEYDRYKKNAQYIYQYSNSRLESYIFMVYLMCEGSGSPHNYARALIDLQSAQSLYARNDWIKSECFNLNRLPVLKTRISILKRIKFDTLLNKVRVHAQSGFNDSNIYYASIYPKLAKLSCDFIKSYDKDRARNNFLFLEKSANYTYTIN